MVLFTRSGPTGRTDIILGDCAEAGELLWQGSRWPRQSDLRDCRRHLA